MPLDYITCRQQTGLYMNFNQALNWMKAGKKVRVPEMYDSYYLVIEDDVLKYLNEYDNHFRITIPLRYLLQTDWEIHEL